MKIEQIPVVEQVFESGAKDRIFDSLLLLGPIVILCIAVFGRSVITQILAISYIAVFVGHVFRRSSE